MNRMLRSLLILVFASAVMASCGAQYRDQDVPMKTVTAFDLERYLGRWYEIERFPNRFEKDCFAVTADYSLKDDGNVRVINTCRKGSVSGPVDSIEGTATVQGIGRLDVGFVEALPFATGDYWVLDLREDYSVAVVGNPRGTTGWILARNPEISDADLAWARGVLENNGYDVSRLMSVQQVVPK